MPWEIRHGKSAIGDGSGFEHKQPEHLTSRDRSLDQRRDHMV
jgi:hypothetical protein